MPTINSNYSNIRKNILAFIKAHKKMLEEARNSTSIPQNHSTETQGANDAPPATAAAPTTPNAATALTPISNSIQTSAQTQQRPQSQKVLPPPNLKASPIPAPPHSKPSDVMKRVRELLINRPIAEVQKFSEKTGIPLWACWVIIGASSIALGIFGGYIASLLGVNTVLSVLLGAGTTVAAAEIIPPVLNTAADAIQATKKYLAEYLRNRNQRTNEIVADNNRMRRTANNSHRHTHASRNNVTELAEVRVVNPNSAEANANSAQNPGPAASPPVPPLASAPVAPAMLETQDEEAPVQGINQNRHNVRPSLREAPFLVNNRRQNRATRSRYPGTVFRSSVLVRNERNIQQLEANAYRYIANLMEEQRNTPEIANLSQALANKEWSKASNMYINLISNQSSFPPQQKLGAR